MTVDMTKEVGIEGFGTHRKELAASNECKCWTLIGLGIMVRS